MGSLDVDSLFTNIPLKETINICTNLLYKNVDVTGGINKSEFENLLSLATQESYFMFNDILYRRYVDDIFVLFESAEHLSKFHAYLNTCHPNMSFSFEQEINDKLSFRGIQSWYDIHPSLPMF